MIKQALAPSADLGTPKTAGMSPYWRIAPLAAITLAVYSDVLRRLGNDWMNDPNFSHGVIVPLFSCFLVWSRMAQLRALPVKPANLGLVGIVCSLLLLIVGSLGAELFLARISLVMLIGAMVVYFLGWAHLRALTFPWLFLLLMIPIPSIIFSQLTLPLQSFAARLATWGLDVVGIPVLREGNVIMLPAMPLEVAEACSGIRSLMTLCTLALIYGYFLESRIAGRILLTAAAVPIAVIANGFRIFGTGILVQYWDADKALGFFHEFSGWIVFMISLFMLMLVHRACRLVENYAARRSAQ